MSLFPTFVSNEFAPMFRLMDDYASHISSRAAPSGFSQRLSSSHRSFVPKFNVKEETDRYVLEGELPGIAQQDINIEFTDSNTLSIKGRTETLREEGTRPTASLENATAQSTTTDGSETNSKRATVEDETPEASTTEGSVIETPAEESSKPATNTSKYWVSERSVGEFARSFSFPNRVDHDSVKASMKDGILSIIVPKAQAPANKRITIE